MSNPIQQVVVYCIDSYVHSKCGTYVCFIRKNSVSAEYKRITRSTGNRLQRMLKNQHIMPKPIITDRFVGMIYEIINL